MRGVNGPLPALDGLLISQLYKRKVLPNAWVRFSSEETASRSRGLDWTPGATDVTHAGAKLGERCVTGLRKDVPRSMSVCSAAEGAYRPSPKK